MEILSDDENGRTSKKPLKVCKSHGDLFDNDIVKSGFRPSGSLVLRCKYCLKDTHRKHYLKNKEKVKKAHEKYINSNKEKVALVKKLSFKKHGHKYRVRSNYLKRISERKDTSTLNDRYVKKTITKRSALSVSDLTPEMIEYGRAILKFKRLLRRKKANGKDKID